MNENKIRKRVKKLLSVTLTAAMLVPSMSYGTIASAAEFEITALDDEFTDGAGQGEEVPVNEAGVNEDAIDVFSDGNLNLAMESSGKKKYTVTIDTGTYKIGSKTMVDVINNHDGTIKISSEKPEFTGTSGELLNNSYNIIYNNTTDDMNIENVKWFEYKYSNDFVNPESENGRLWEWRFRYKEAIYEQTIDIKSGVYTVFGAVTEKNNNYYIANIQVVENPVEVTYSFNGGTDGPTTDWVCNWDGEWKKDHDTKIPKKEGYQFKGWYTGDGIKIETVQDAVSHSDMATTPETLFYKKIKLQAKWVHKQHSWNYISDENNKNIIKGYCSGKDCEYYADSEDNIGNYVVLELGLKGNETNNIIYSGSPVEAVIKNNTFTNAAVSEITYKKMNKDTDEYTECDTPVNAGKYRAEVTIGDDNNNATASIEYEIKKATIGNFNVSLESFPYGSPARIQLLGEPEGSEVTYQYKVKDSEDSEYKSINEEALKTFPVGEYTLKATVRESVNYEGASATCDFKVTKADISSENSKVHISDWTYGSYNEAENIPSVDVNPGKGNVTYTYYTDANYTLQTNNTDDGAISDGRIPKNAGIYYVKALIEETANYKAGTATGSFEIKKATPQIILPEKTLTYTGKAADYSFSEVTLTGDENYNKETHGEIKYSYRIWESNENLTDGLPVHAGTYEVQATLAESKNYNGTFATAKLVINPKTVTVKPDSFSKHIGEHDPDFTYGVEGLIDGEDLTGIKLERKDTSEDAGEYEITAEMEGANPNYNVKLEKGKLTITDHSWDVKELVPATAWSEGMQEKTCTVQGCTEKRYDTIPKKGGTKSDPYADKIDKHAKVSGVDIKWAGLNNTETELFNAAGIFGNNKTNISETKKAKVLLKITEPTPEQEKLIDDKVKEIAGKNANKLIFNMDLYKQSVNDDAESQITEPKINISIRLGIPDNMINNQSYTIRNYKIIRLHDDNIDVLDTSFNSNTNEITFETDKFSVYALTYKDTYYSPSYPVTGIKVSPETLTLTKKDETAQLTAEVTPSYADNKRVTWKSSDEKVATVDENGKVTAVSNGTATITATSVSGNYTATVSVTVKIPVEIEKITIETEKETLTKIGESTELKVKIEPENADPQKLTWKSSDDKVAIVDENGKVTAAANGTVTITVTTEDGKHTASVTITVNIPDEPVISNTTGFGRLKARSTKQTKISVTLEWSRIDDADGYFIYGSRCNTSTKSYKYKKLATITNGNTRTWTQKGLKKATYYKYVVKAYKVVNGKKVVTDTSASIHTVTQGGKYGVAKSVSVTKIGNKKNVTKLTLKKGKTAQITAKEIKKDNKIKQHRNLCYESSNTKVATVTSKGLIRAVGKGTCTIWVYAQNGVYKALTITVK